MTQKLIGMNIEVSGKTGVSVDIFVTELNYIYVRVEYDGRRWINYEIEMIYEIIKNKKVK